MVKQMLKIVQHNVCLTILGTLGITGLNETNSQQSSQENFFYLFFLNIIQTRHKRFSTSIGIGK